MFAKQLLTASLSRSIIQGFSYNVTVSSHVKLVEQRHRLEKEAADKQHTTHTRCIKERAKCNY